MNEDITQYPIRILNLFTIMDRGGAETMVMNYYRHIDRTKVQFDFLVHREQPGAYEDEIRLMGGRIYRMCPIYPQNFARYKRDIRVFFKSTRNTRSFIRTCLSWAILHSKKLLNREYPSGFVMRTMLHTVLI